MSKHTAGEWKYQHRHVWANDYKTETLSDGSEVELNHRICEVDEGPTEAQAEANARRNAQADHKRRVLAIVKRRGWKAVIRHSGLIEKIHNRLLSNIIPGGGIYFPDQKPRGV